MRALDDHEFDPFAHCKLDVLVGDLRQVLAKWQRARRPTCWPQPAPTSVHSVDAPIAQANVHNAHLGSHVPSSDSTYSHGHIGGSAHCR